MHLSALYLCPSFAPPSLLPYHFFLGCVGACLVLADRSTGPVTVTRCVVRLLIYLFVYQGFSPSLQTFGFKSVHSVHRTLTFETTACPQKVEDAARTWVFISLMTLTFCPMEPCIRLSDFLWLVLGYCSLTGLHRYCVNVGGRQCPGDHLGRYSLISVHGCFSSLLKSNPWSDILRLCDSPVPQSSFT